MWKNYIIANLRMLWKNRMHSTINLVGLSLGMTCAIVIFLVVRFELSFDQFHNDTDRIYRIVTEYQTTNGPIYGAGTTYALPPAVRDDFADLEYVTLVDCNYGDPVISVTREDGSVDRYKEHLITFADPEYFSIFKYEWIEGNDDALKGDKTVALSETAAIKFFGSTQVVGKSLNVNSTFDVVVSGVFKNPPTNTDFPFHMIFSNKLGADKHGWDNWDSTSSSVQCYVKLNEGTSAEAFDAKLDGWQMKYFKGALEEDGKERRYFLEPLNEIHFDARFGNFGGRVVSIPTIWSLSLIGLFLLLTACINFINLNTVLIVNRSKEAGIRKVLGSTRRQIMFQFLGETFLITVVALLLSGALSEIMLLKLNPILGYRLSLTDVVDQRTLVFFAFMPLIVTLLAGAYPAYRLSWFQPVKVLKGRISDRIESGLSLRRTLIVVQLVIAQVLVVSTIVILQQLQYFSRQPTGVNSEAVLEFEIPDNKPELLHTLKERLQRVTDVQFVTMSNTGTTSGNTWGGDFTATVKGNQVKENTDVKFADDDYLETYGLTLLAGEGLIKSDTANRFVVNESFVKKLGLQDERDALGIETHIWGRKALITGVVKDFHTTSFHNEQTAVIIMSGASGVQVGAVKLKTGDLRQAVDDVKAAWESVYPTYVFESTFLDETIAAFYDAERKNGYLISLFAGIAILIGCIGLFGLVSFMAKQKTKEIGIRKTLGATVAQVMTLFSREFVVLILVSFVIAAPLAYYIMSQWLGNFAYRITPGVTTFLAGIAVTFIVVLVTVGMKSYNAATANPADALRDE